MHLRHLFLPIILATALLAVLLSTAVALAATLRTYSASPNLVIPDGLSSSCSPGAPGAVATNTIVVTDSDSIYDLNVMLNITHPWSGDLVVTLTHVDTGTAVTIIDRPGPGGCGTSTANIVVTLDDGAAQSSETASPLTGVLRPSGALSAFSGQNIQGTWRLEVRDYVDGDEGTLVSWSLVALTGPPDADGDGVPDASDNCPAAANADQANLDGDGQGDACDPDDDGDGIDDGFDNCALVANPDQADADGDGQGDVCDGDMDGDGVLDGADNCPLAANLTQADADGDGHGDACDPTPTIPGVPEVPWTGWNPGDGRLNPDPGAPLAIYCDADSVFAYIPDYLEFDFPLSDIGQGQPVQAAVQRTLIAEAPGGARLYLLSTGEYQLVDVVDGQEVGVNVAGLRGASASGGASLLTEGASGARLYRLSTGELQVNFAHGGEEYVLTWDGCPATTITTRVYDAATRALLSEFTRRP